MATVLQFNLSADDIERIMTVPGSARRIGILTGILAAAGAAGVVEGAIAKANTPIVVGVAAIVIAAVFVAFLWQMPRTRATMAARLSGPAKLKLTDAGVQYNGAGLTEKFAWNQVSVINDRPEGWIMTVRSTGAFIIPKSAVSGAQANVLTTQLRGWAAGKYRIRRR